MTKTKFIKMWNKNKDMKLRIITLTSGKEIFAEDYSIDYSLVDFVRFDRGYARVVKTVKLSDIKSIK